MRGERKVGFFEKIFGRKEPVAAAKAASSPTVSAA
jgi:hypothetical protein